MKFDILMLKMSFHLHRCFFCNTAEFTKKIKVPIDLVGEPNGDFDFFGEFHGITPKTPMYIYRFIFYIFFYNHYDIQNHHLGDNFFINHQKLQILFDQGPTTHICMRQKPIWSQMINGPFVLEEDGEIRNRSLKLWINHRIISLPLPSPFHAFEFQCDDDQVFC